MPTKLLGADHSHPPQHLVDVYGITGGGGGEVIPFAVVELFGLGGLLADLLVLSLWDFIWA